jgi:Zn-finger protein
LLFHSVLRKLYTELSIGAFYQISVHSEDFLEITRKKNCLWWPCLLTDRDEMSNLKRGLSIDASYQVLVHLAKRFQRKIFFRNRPFRNKNCLWWPCLLTYQDEMSNVNRGTSIDASYQVSVHLARRFQRRIFFRNQPIRNKNCLWWPCLLTNRDKMSNLYRGSFIDACYQVSFHLAKRLYRRFLEINQSETRTDFGGHVC